MRSSFTRITTHVGMLLNYVLDSERERGGGGSVKLKNCNEKFATLI
jgi:hypothetical protein